MDKMDYFIAKHGMGTFILLIVLTVIVCLAISFGISSLLVYIACWAFGFHFTWKLAIGVYVVLALIGGFLKSNVTTNK